MAALSGGWEPTETRSAVQSPPSTAWGYFNVDRPFASAVAVVPTPLLVVLTRLGRYVGTAKGDSGAYFYDLDSGDYFAMTAGGEKTWRVLVQGATVSVVEVSGAGGGAATHAYATVG